MKIGYIGLGKMGFNMVTRLLEKGHEVAAFDSNPEVVGRIAQKGAHGAGSLQELIQALQAPRIMWLMVPHEGVDAVLTDLVAKITAGDIIIDGGNSHYKETIRRSRELGTHSIALIDCGTSGGPRGAREGACCMIGGEREVFQNIEPLIRDIAAEGAYGYMGKSGAGHFVKMVHNGIEYGMMQAIAEGFSILKKSDFMFDLTKIADLYNHRSVIESRLVKWLKETYETKGQELSGIAGSTAQSGEGEWTVMAAGELGIPAPIINGALQFRKESFKNPSYTGQILSALRNQFGGHDVGIR